MIKTKCVCCGRELELPPGSPNASKAKCARCLSWCAGLVRSAWLEPSGQAGSQGRQEKEPVAAWGSSLT